MMWEEECYICEKHVGVSYTDLMKMPVSSRRNRLFLLKKESEKIKEHINNANTGSGKKRRISGDELVNKMRSGEIK